MVEELFVIKNGEKVKLDLNTPSGISLVFKSNLFGDVSKITCSHSYTFKLPLTLNNRIALESAEDVRKQSNMTRKKLNAEFSINGIMLFQDANLYIDTIDTCYQAVMTWGVVKGMQTLKDYDVSLRELPTITGVARYGVMTDNPRPANWHNEMTYFIPWRTSEGSYWYNNEQYLYQRDYGSSALPVIPIYLIVKAINEYFGTKFNFGSSLNGAEHWDSASHKYVDVSGDSLINFGAVPLVNRELTDAQYEARTGTFKNVAVLNNSFWGVALKVWDDCRAYNVLSFDFTPGSNNSYYSIGNNGSTSGTTRKYTIFKKAGAIVEKVAIDGRITVSFSNIGTRFKNNVAEFSREDVVPKLIIYRRTFQLKEGSSTNGEIVYNEAVTIEGKRKGYDIVQNEEYLYQFAIFEFDFSQENGRSRLELDDFNTSSETYPYFISINDEVREVKEVSDFKIIPAGNISDDIKKGWEVDIRTNLPDVSCLTFIKSLYYMMGAFPNSNSDGEIYPYYYHQLYRNISNGNAVDWTKKVATNVMTLPDKISFAVSGFSRKNYYLMKNDDLENKSEKGDDIYESGMGCIVCDNETLDKETTVIQVPYYGAFLQDGSRPQYDTGKDMKYKKFNDDDSTSFSEAKPAIGIVEPIEECLYQEPITDQPTCIGQGTYTMLFRVWNGFKNIDENPSYDALQTIINKPIVVTEQFHLTELDLRDLDYSVPVYLQKYNSYFAIISITRDSKGICKCELIKLP